ncbi:hypothetical protein AB0K57_30570 [Streptomyces halstedii]|uniref:hypothetical protein n=1 Tax=Streptomyces halstedii TaxID=1944 RepID=UPI00345FCE6A
MSVGIGVGRKAVLEMASRKKDLQGPFPYPTAGEWPEKLYRAIVSTCADAGLVPPPRQAVIEGLAPTLAAGEAKRVVETPRNGEPRLKAAAYHIEGRGTPHALLLLNLSGHGAGMLPWALNDRTRSSWVRPTAENIVRHEHLVAAELALAGAEASLRRAKGAQRALGRGATSAEKDAAVKAVEAAQAVRERVAVDHRDAVVALGARRPLPLVEAAQEDGAARTALTTELMSVDLAASVQRFAVQQMRERGRLRPYDLVESMSQEGQRESTVAVLQQTRMTDPDGTRFSAWRLMQVTGNNRADARLQIFGIESEHLLTGVPQPLLVRDGEKADRNLLLRGLPEILRRVSGKLNAERVDSVDPEQDTECRSSRAERIAEVPVRVVVGAASPARLEASLRDLNIHDHLRGQLLFEDEDRSLGLWTLLVTAYQEANLLTSLLAGELTGGRVEPSSLDEPGIVDALVGAGPLDPLAALLPTDVEPAPADLRDMAIRCTTVLLFPPVPPRPKDLPPRAWMPTGRYWPVVRGALQEAPWSSKGGKRAERRTEVWAAAIAQHFVHQRNLAAMGGLFSAEDTQYGVVQDRRSLDVLIAACETGDAAAWNVLVRRHMVPGLVNAAEPFITAGQGSETSAERKGDRRTPSNAVLALVRAFTEPERDSVTHALLVAFARSVLGAPEAADGVDGKAPGTFWALGADGSPRVGVLADKGWYDLMFPKLAGARTGRGDDATDEDQNAEDHSESIVDEGDETEQSARSAHDFVDPAARAAELREQVTPRIDQLRESVDAALEQAVRLAELVEDAVKARSEAGFDPEPAEVQRAYAKAVAGIRKKNNAISERLGDTLGAVMDL